MGERRDQGFTLVELLIVIMIVGILATTAVPVYLGYSLDSRTAQGKALAGSALSALQGCAQAKGVGGTCALADITGRVGVSTGGVTGDGRWTVVTAGLTVSSTTPPTFTGTITVRGSGTDTMNLAIGMYPTNTGVVLRCTSTTSTPPAINAGEPC